MCAPHSGGDLVNAYEVMAGVTWSDC